MRRFIELAEQVLEAGGPGSSYAIERALAGVVRYTGPGLPEDELIPFWERMMMPRHKFGRRDATAALRSRFGGRALCDLAASGSARARTAMLGILPCLAAADRGELLVLAAIRGLVKDDSAWIEAAERIAVDDKAFEARYLARCTLRLVERQVPTDAAHAIYSFELRCGEFSCVIAIAASSLLDELHDAIQCALEWDGDHLWCMYLNGTRCDHRFTWPEDGWVFNWVSSMVDQIDSGKFHFGDDAIDPQPDRIGELGLRVGNKLIYHFDFGDNHLIPLKVLTIREPLPSSMKLPAITKRSGKPPKQYPSY